MNVLGQYIFSAENGAAYSSTVLANPYDSTVTLDTGFLSIPALDNTIIDPHFYQRDRMGRLVTFMARLTNNDSQWATPGTTIKGMGIDQQTALLVDTTGRDSDNPTHAIDFATVVGNKSGDVHFLETTGKADTCVSGTPLGYTTNPISVRRATVGQTLNLDTIWTSTSNAYTDYTLTVMAGMLYSSQQGNSIY